MIEKFRKNIGLVLGLFTLLGAVAGGINTAGRMVDTLSTIDERVSNLESIIAENQVEAQISVLYEKIYQLEQYSYDSQYLEDRVLILEQQVYDLDSKLYDIEYIEDRLTFLEANQSNHYHDNQDANAVDTWEFDQLKDRVLIIETQFNDKWWKFDDFDWRIDDIRNQVDDLWSMTHGH
tara:strand:+ start:2275 stop:2808 length:534 start_codon:yes stop_codon:yes gene_type:complete